MTTKPTEPTKPTAKTARPRRAKAATEHASVEAVQSVPAGKVAVVTLRDWLPASGMKQLREELKAATGHEPVILPPGATLRTISPKDTSAE